MFVFVISWSGLYRNHVRSKTSSLGQICSKHCSPSRGHNFISIDIRFNQNISLGDISVKFKHGYFGSNTRSLGQISLKPCSLSRGHNLALISMEPYQNICFDNILVKFEYVGLKQCLVGIKIRSLG